MKSSGHTSDGGVPDPWDLRFEHSRSHPSTSGRPVKFCVHEPLFGDYPTHPTPYPLEPRVRETLKDYLKEDTLATESLEDRRGGDGEGGGGRRWTRAGLQASQYTRHQGAGPSDVSVGRSLSSVFSPGGVQSKMKL